MTYFSHELLCDATLQLLSSNNTQRYNSQAKKLAKLSGLLEKVKYDANLHLQIIQYGKSLIEQIKNNTERLPIEAELALIICIIADPSLITNMYQANSLLMLVLKNNDENFVWLRHLTKYLIE